MSQREGGLTAGFRFGVLVNVVLICGLATLLAFGAVYFMQRLSYKVDVRMDVTRDRRYSIDPGAEKLLRELGGPLSITFVWGADLDIKKRVPGPDGRPRNDLINRFYLPLLKDLSVPVEEALLEWPKNTEMATFESFPAHQNPQRAEDLARSMGRSAGDIINRVIFRYANRTREVSLRSIADVEWGLFPPNPQVTPTLPFIRGRWRVQTELTEALRALVAGEAVKVGVVAGLDSVMEIGTDGFAPFQYTLEGQGYVVEPLTLATVDDVPSHLAAVILGGVRHELSEHDRDVLKAYEGKGGRLLVFTDPRIDARHDALLEPYGVKVLPEVIDDPANMAASSRGTGHGLILSRDLFVGRHEIERDLRGRVSVGLGVTGHAAVQDDMAPGAVRTTLLQGSGSATAIPMRYPAGSYGEPVPSQRRTGLSRRPSFAGALPRPRPAEAEARIVLFTGTDLIRAGQITDPSLGNANLVLNSLAWLTNRTQSIGTRSETDRQHVFVDPKDVEKPLYLFGVLGFTVIALGLAVVSTLARRN